MSFRRSSISQPITDDEWSRTALSLARDRRRRTPFKDGDTVAFVRIAEHPAVSGDWDEQVRYWEMRLSGESHAMAEVLATRSFPVVKTDSVFAEGRFSGESGQVAKEQLWLREHAESRGVSTNGKWYSRGLARYPGDPKAWIDSRADVTRIAAENNMTVHGYVEHRGREVEPMPDVAIDPRLVHAEAMDVVESMPGSKYEEVYERVRDLRTGKIDNSPLLVED